jgi:hypothetical protein
VVVEVYSRGNNTANYHDKLSHIPDSVIISDQDWELQFLRNSVISGHSHISQV